MVNLLNIYEKNIKSSSTINNAVYLTLKEAIMTCKLQGEISENQISSILDISRTPVRDAMNKLRADGILEICRGRPAKIKHITNEDVRDICALLRGLYDVSMELCIRNASDKEVSELDEIVGLIDFFVKRRNIEKVTHFNALFHLRVCQYSRNKWLLNTVESLSKYTDNHRFKVLQDPQRMEASYEDHLILLNVIKNRDLKNISSAVHHHVRADYAI